MSLRFSLLLLALLAPASLAQAPPESAALPAGIEATGDTAEVRALTAWAEEHHRQSHPEQAERAARRALALARNLDDQRGIGAGFRILGTLILSSDPSQAERYFAGALEASEQIGDAHGVAESRRKMGVAHSHRGEPEMALDAYFDALSGFKRLGDTEGQAATLTGIGIAHSIQGNLEEALTYYERAVTMSETLDNPIRLVAPLTNYGTALADYGSYEKAETTLRRALAISEEGGLRYNAAAASNNLGRLYNEQGRYEQGLPFLLTAEQVSMELGDNETLGAVYDELGKAYMGLEQYHGALEYANESLELAKQSGSVADQMMVYQTLSRIYEAAGDDTQALAHHRQYATAKDSVFTAERAESIAEMQTRYETEEKQRAIERLEQENHIQTLRASRRQTLLLGGVGALLLILGALFYRYRLNQRANRLLEDLDRAKSRFFANISHEFRTPLTVILGSVQDALAGHFKGDEEKFTAQLQAMQRNSRQLQRLIDEVLDLNRLEAGKLELHPAPDDLVLSIKRIVEADTPLAERNGISLTFKHEVENCPRLFDEEKLEKIVGNLLSNALKFTPRGGSVRVSLNDGKETTITVADDGPGIPAEMQEKVFERFAQVEDGSHHGGTGIGLALAKELAELLGGTITLESEPGEGSTLTVRLPLETVALDDVAPHGRAALQTADSAPPEQFAVGGNGLLDATPPEGEATSEESDRTTVLIIEDNHDVRAFVRRSLEETYRVIEAADGEAGLQQARSELPDLIVSDVMLPGIDGYEVARRLKAETDTECIPVVMLTARAAEEDQTESYGSGAEVYITKPFSPEALRAAIERLFEERRRLRKRLQDNAKQGRQDVSPNGHPTFMDRARAGVLQHLHDENFGVEELASSLNMTRQTLYNRLKSEIDLSPSDFIRTLRLERARELLSDGAGSVSEVAYAVGFKSRSHFTHRFREHYGTSPLSVLSATKG